MDPKVEVKCEHDNTYILIALVFIFFALHSIANGIDRLNLTLRQTEALHRRYIEAILPTPEPPVEREK